jgi:hypothetical protein
MACGAGSRSSGVHHGAFEPRAEGRKLILIVLAIPLLIVVVIHVVFQIRSIGTVEHAKPGYVRAIVVSNFLLFGLFAMQPDSFLDSPDPLLPILFRPLALHYCRDWRTCPAELAGTLWVACLVCFIALIRSWIYLARRRNELLIAADPKSKKPARPRSRAD